MDRVHLKHPEMPGFNTTMTVREECLPAMRLAGQSHGVEVEVLQKGGEKYKPYPKIDYSVTIPQDQTRVSLKFRGGLDPYFNAVGRLMDQSR